MIGSYFGYSLNLFWKLLFYFEVPVTPLTAEFVLEPVLLLEAADRTLEPGYMPFWPMKLRLEGETG